MKPVQKAARDVSLRVSKFPATNSPRNQGYTVKNVPQPGRSGPQTGGDPDSHRPKALQCEMTNPTSPGRPRSMAGVGYDRLTLVSGGGGKAKWSRWASSF